MKKHSGRIVVTLRLTARFENKELANLAILRLRRNEIDFSVGRLSVSGPQEGRSGVSEMENRAVSGYGGWSSVGMQPFGMQSLLTGAAAQKGEAVLKLSIRGGQYEKAKEILKSAGAVEIDQK
jgi:hypothetical protein